MASFGAKSICATALFVGLLSVCASAERQPLNNSGRCNGINSRRKMLDDPVAAKAPAEETSGPAARGSAGEEEGKMDGGSKTGGSEGKEDGKKDKGSKTGGSEGKEDGKKDKGSKTGGGEGKEEGENAEPSPDGGREGKEESGEAEGSPAGESQGRSTEANNIPEKGVLGPSRN